MTSKRRKGQDGGPTAKAVAPNKRLADCFAEIAAAVTPADRVLDWDWLEVLPRLAETHHRWSELLTLIEEDEHLRHFFSKYMVSTGTGADAGWDAGDLAQELIAKPWDRVELQGGRPTAASLEAAATSVIDDARRLAAGHVIHVPARFMFDGPQMSRRFSRDTAFGRVCWTKIPPPYAGAPWFEGLTVFTAVPLHLPAVPDNAYFYAPKYNKTTEAIDRFVSQFRVALLSRGNRGKELGPPARVSLVQLNALPIGRGNHHFGELADAGHGGPVRDLVEVCDVMERYQRAWHPRVDTAARRLVQSMARSGQEVAGHLDEDALVDASIALESLFAMSQELSFRLAVGIAHLLGKNADERESIFRRVKRIYKLRSAIVHGNASQVPDLIYEEKSDAIRIGLDVLETLLFERRGLLDTKEWDLPVIFGQESQ